MDDEKKVAIRELAASDGPHDRRNHPEANAEPPGHAQVGITKGSIYFSRFVDLSGEAMYVRVNSRLVFVNTHFTELSGYTAEELLAPDFDFMTLIAPASRLLIEGRLEQITRLETPPLHYTFQAVTKDGRLVDVESSVSYLSYSGGLATIGVCRDVTERLVLAGRIAEDKYRRHQFADLGSDFIHECRRDGPEGFQFVWLDGAFTRVTGYSREELMAFRCWLPLIHHEDASPIREILSGMKGDDRHTLVFRLVTKDGRIRWIEDNTLCVADRRLPDTCRLYGACRDITDRKDAELLYTVLAESSFAGVYVVQDGIFRYLNKNAALCAEYTPEELTGSHAGVLVHPEDEARTRRRAQEMLSGQRLTPYEFRIITKSGGVRWIMETVSAIEYQGQPAILGNSMDVTEKMNMENALLESEARYRQLFENAVEGFFQSTPHGTYISVNPAFARMCGYASPEEIMAAVTNIGAQLYVHQEDRREIGRLLETQEFVEGLEAEFRRKDGVLIWGTINARAIRDERGEICYYEGTIVDITERKRAEEEFRRQYRFLRTLLDSIPVPLYYVDARGVCGGCNQAFADFIARTTEEIVGVSLDELWQEGSGASGPHLTWGDEGAQEVRVYETVLTRADNTPRDVIVSRAPFFNLDGSRGGEIGSFIDITDRKAAERELERHRHHLEELVRERTEGLELEIAERRRTEQALLRAKEAAEAANRAKSAFLANMSHELRTPLNAVIGFSDVLIKQYFGPLNDKQEEYARDIAASGQHLLDLINDVLDLAKIEAGKDDLYYAPVSLPELFGSSLSIFREKARRHNLELRIEGEESLAGLAVTADARKLKQALYNLLSNATKFTPDGGRIIVRARVVDEIVPGEKGGSRGIEISVTDTGIGIAREDLEKIFEEFHQVYDPTVGKNPGTGLGLALTRRVIALHGGCIWVESAGLGKGSAFIFRIPCAPPQGNMS